MQDIGALGFGTAISGIVACASLLSAGLLANPDVLPSLGGDGADLVVPDALVLADPTSPDRTARDAVARAVAQARTALDARESARADEPAAGRRRRAATDDNGSGTSSTRTSGRRTDRSGAPTGSSDAPLPSSAPSRDGSAQPVGTDPSFDVPVVPVPSTTTVATPVPTATAASTRRVSLRLADTDLTPAKGKAAGTLRLRYAVTEQTTTDATTTTTERAPIDVTLQVPRALRDESVRVSVDLDLTTSEPTVRVRVAVADPVVAPTVGETATATDTASNALDVVVPLDAPVSEAPVPTEAPPAFDAEVAPPVTVTSAQPATVEVALDGPRETTVPVSVTVSGDAAAPDVAPAG